MESRRHHQRSRSARGPPTLPPLHQPHPRHHHHPPPHHRQNPSHSPAAASSFVYRPHQPMEEDAISTLMDIDDSPLSAAGAGFLDEEDGDGEMFLAPHRAGRGGGGGETRGPLLFSGFFNSFDGADFDDDDLA
ncbi:forkhead box protein G1 [Sorghum bicolor]|nr:forkhead box protein G1 [Sorghum bicolor]|eukprot:XP_002452466.2 forkhead box protein G1 [Sorghum bicolor]